MESVGDQLGSFVVVVLQGKDTDDARGTRNNHHVNNATEQPIPNTMRRLAGERKFVWKEQEEDQPAEG